MGENCVGWAKYRKYVQKIKAGPTINYESTGTDQSLFYLYYILKIDGSDVIYFSMPGFGEMAYLYTPPLDKGYSRIPSKEVQTLK